MDQKSLFYAESARRRARKAKALQEGEEAQQRHEPGGKLGPLWEHRPPRAQKEPAAKTPAARSGPPQSGAPKQSAPAKTPRPPRPATSRAAAPRPAASRPAAPGSTSRATPAPRRAPASASSARPKAPPPQLRASEDRRLLESQELDLFGTGKTAIPHICPQCQHELTKVVCMGLTVRVCLECLGTWLPYPVVQEFASKIDWFRELRPAVQRFRSSGPK